MTENPNEKPEIDLKYIESLLPFGALMATKQQASDERQITELVHACLVEHTNLTEKQREQFQLAFHRTDIPLFRVVELQVPNDTPGDPRLFACQWTENKWHVVPMPTALTNFPPEA